MKEITTNGITILLVEVEKGATYFQILPNKGIFVNGDSIESGVVDFLPKGNWQILGKSTELSKEQMKEICEFRFGNQSEYLEAGFIDYNAPVRNGFGDKYILNKETVQESYLSLLEANGIDNNKIHLVLKMI